MLNKDVKKLNEILLERKAHVEKSLAEMGHRKGGGEFDIPFSEYGTTTDENATEFSEWERLKVTESALESELDQINKALESVERGEYGICRNCQKPIEPPRLKVVPSAITCVQCAKIVAF